MLRFVLTDMKPPLQIADHTTRHESLPGRDAEYLQQETAGARAKIAEQCGIPEVSAAGRRLHARQSEPTPSSLPPPARSRTSWASGLPT